MPLSGGTSGAHDDSMHQGSAKRDTANGVAALNGSGELLCPGSILYLARDGSNHIKLRERTSGEQLVDVTRVGAYDYAITVLSGGVACDVQLSNMKDVVNGIAALDAAGSLLLPGSKMYYTRDGSDDVHIYERTSNEEAYAFHRVGANDYTFFVKESNVWKRMQTESMKDVANGIAGLDANVQLDVLQMRSCLEEYSNHLGAVDNFTQTFANLNASATADATNHEMDLSTGITNAGYAYFQTKKTFPPSTKPLLCNILIQNIVSGAGGVRETHIGFCENFASPSIYHRATFYQINDGSWRVGSYDGSTVEYTNITALSNGDHTTIVVTSAKVIFLVNGAIVATHTTNIPSNGLRLGAQVYDSMGNATTAREISIDMMGVKRWY